jgi:hypothetical protein
LTTRSNDKKIAEDMDRLERDQKWKPDDLMIYRCGFEEADLLPQLDERARERLRPALAAPLTSLYVGDSRRPCLLLPRSARRGPNHRTNPEDVFDPAAVYNDAAAAKIARHGRYWLCTAVIGRGRYLDCVVPWIANSQPCDLEMARRRADPERHFIVPAGAGPDDDVPGLTDARPTDFTDVVLVQRWRISAAFVPALGDATGPNGHFAAPLWIVTQSPTPATAQNPASPRGEGD